MLNPCGCSCATTEGCAAAIAGTMTPVKAGNALFIACPSADRLVHCDKLGAVGERGFDLDVVDHLGDAIHHLLAGKNLATVAHQFGDAPAVACAFHNEIGYQRDGFRMVQL